MSIDRIMPSTVGQLARGIRAMGELATGDAPRVSLVKQAAAPKLQELVGDAATSVQHLGHAGGDTTFVRRSGGMMTFTTR